MVVYAVPSAAEDVAVSSFGSVKGSLHSWELGSTAHDSHDSHESHGKVHGV